MSYREYEDIRYGLKEMGECIGWGLAAGLFFISVALVMASHDGALVKINVDTIVREQSAKEQ